MYKYIVEKYTDEHEYLHQVIMIEQLENQEELNKLRRMLRSTINHDLIWLYEISYLDERHLVQLTETYDINGNLIKKEEPWRFKSKYDIKRKFISHIK